ncbi:enoyl-CoA-hydratase DpgB [Streptomyces sp. NPDC021969]|uniref:enoyl-CoA-hydratase DpgB n=1 Tax=unclassified Streptomyces TaxID=2593676 RepID=UPI0033F3E9B1
MSDKTAVGGDGEPLRLWFDNRQPLTQEIIATVNRACDRLEDATEPTVAVFELVGGTGDERAPWPGEVGVHSANRWERAVRRIEQADAPTVAVVQGTCSGATMELLLATDYRIATPSSTFGLGGSSDVLWPSMALYRLVQQLGVARARRLALFGGEIGAEEALAAGLIDRIEEQPGDTLGTLLESLAGLSGSEVRVRRQLLLEAATTSYDQAVGVHLSACDRALRHHEKQTIGA